jgi:hypothetical protein
MPAQNATVSLMAVSWLGACLQPPTASVLQIDSLALVELVEACQQGPDCVLDAAVVAEAEHGVW